MSFPKKGNSFPANNAGLKSDHRKIDSKIFAAEVAAALNGALGKTSAHIKIVAAWTGANDRTVKNWFAGHYGPSGDHLVTLIRHSDAVLTAMLSMAGRGELLINAKFDEIEKRLIELTALVQCQIEKANSSRDRLL